MQGLLNKTFTLYKRTDKLFEGELSGTTTITCPSFTAPFHVEIEASGVTTSIGTLTIVGSTTESIEIKDAYAVGSKEFTSVTSLTASTTMTISVYTRDNSGSVVYGWVESKTGKCRLSNHSSQYAFFPYGESERTRYVVFTDVEGISPGDMIEVDDVSYRVLNVYNVYGAKTFHHAEVDVEEREEEEL